MRNRREQIKDQIIRLQVLKLTNNSKEIEKWIQSLYKKLLTTDEKV